MCKEESNSCNILAFKIDVESIDNKVLDINNYYVLYKDNNKIKVYDVNNKVSNTYDKVENNYDKYNLINYENKLYGISYGLNISDLNGYVNFGREIVPKFYDIKTNSNKYDGYYVSSAIDHDLLNLMKISNQDNKTMNLLDYNNDKFIIEGINNSRAYFGFKEDFIILHECPSIGPYCKMTYYTTNGEKIFVDSNSYNSDIVDKTLYTLSNNLLQKYSTDGSVVDSKKYTDDYDLYAIYDNFVVALKNDNINMINSDTYEEMFVVKLDKDDEFIDCQSGKYNLNTGDPYDDGIYSISTNNKQVYFDTNKKQIVNGVQ